MITFDIILVFIVIVLILISLYWGLLGPSLTFVIGVSILGFFGILTPSEILSGFANEQIAVVINLIVNGMVMEQNIMPGLEPLKIFDFAPIGFTMLIIGYFYLVFFGDKLMPEREEPLSDHPNYSREFTVEAKIRPGSHLHGMKVGQAGYTGNKNFELVEIIRDNIKVLNYSDDLILNEGDLLIFSGEPGNIAEIISKKSGLQIPEVGMMSKRKKTEIIEIVISQNSSLIGKTLKTVNFRSRFDAAAIAIHRNGFRILEKLDSVMLRAGDILLLFTGNKFLPLSENTNDFYFISKVRRFEKLEWYKTTVLLGGLVLAIGLSALNVIQLFMGLVALLIATLALKITNPKDLSRSIDYNLAIIIVLSIALGTAMAKTGAADLVADSIISVFLPYGEVSVLFGIFIITSLLAAYITAKAAAAIVFPISLTMALNLGMDPLPFILIVAFASAANFMTPIGFQTNLMIYGPGGYKYTDFLKVGFPLTIIYMFVTVGILARMYF